MLFRSIERQLFEYHNSTINILLSLNRVSRIDFFFFYNFCLLHNEKD